MSIKKYFQHHKISSSLLGVGTLIFIGLLLMWLTKSYPIAMVGSNLISAREVQEQIDLAKKFDPKAGKQQAFDQLVLNVKKEQMVGKLDLDKELQFYKTDRAEEYNKFLNDYFSGDEKLFVKFVVAPKAYDAQLMTKYNSDFGANNNAYNKAENIISRLNQAESFEDLAKTYSDDKISGQLGGDLGFVSAGQLLPELEKALQQATVGEVKKQIVVSRLGYHILYPVEVAEKDGQKITHLKHILITTSGYDNWLSGQLEKIGVRRFGSI